MALKRPGRGALSGHAATPDECRVPGGTGRRPHDSGTDV